ncbi:unnamed protein product [Meganyctiphanes norvegica]|uniref:Uncharacterized protein n=1 Tax=Meganyctiphanes norvegica TaxID=48144 RepID=A0AAV2PTJ7_MEGNR
MCPCLPTVPHLNKVYYFTGGCAAQYKNRYNFQYIFKYLGDLGLQCRWYFFVTSHSKCSCDGIGGTVKRSVDKASLQKVFERYILTPEDMVKYCKEFFLMKK